MRNPFRREHEERSLNNPHIPISAAAIVQYFQAGNRTVAGVDVSETTAMRNMAVLRAVTLTSGTVASLPLKIYKDQPNGRKEVESNLFRDPMNADLDMTWFEGIELIVTHIMLWGNAYLFKVKNEMGFQTIKLIPIFPERVEVKMTPSGKLFKVQGMETAFTADDILHIPGMGYDGVRGLSPIEMGRQAIGSAIAAEQVAAALFDSGLMMGGILQAEEDITDEQAFSAKQRFKDNNSGISRAHEIALLSRGFKFTPAQIPPKDAQWLETRKFGVEEIARLYGIPADLLFENSATGNTNAEERAISWVKFGLKPLLERIESRLSMHLLPRGQFCEFNVDGLLRGDSKTEAEVLQIAVNAGWMTRNEVRALKNLAPLPGGDDLLTPKTEIPASIPGVLNPEPAGPSSAAPVSPAAAPAQPKGK